MKFTFEDIKAALPPNAAVTEKNDKLRVMFPNTSSYLALLNSVPKSQIVSHHAGDFQHFAYIVFSE